MGRVGIAVAGASCSGKTTLAKALAAETGATILRLDDYYRPLDHLTYDERCAVNFDHPDAIESSLLVHHVRALLSGETVDVPEYDFTRHTRFGERRPVAVGGLLIVEGLFALCYPGLAELCATRIFVDAPRDVCLQRRLIRDTTERGRTPTEVVGRFTDHVWPMYERHIAPTRAYATMEVSGVAPVRRSVRDLMPLLPVAR